MFLPRINKFIFLPSYELWWVSCPGTLDQQKTRCVLTDRAGTYFSPRNLFLGPTVIIDSYHSLGTFSPFNKTLNPVTAVILICHSSSKENHDLIKSIRKSTNIHSHQPLNFTSALRQVQTGPTFLNDVFESHLLPLIYFMSANHVDGRLRRLWFQVISEVPLQSGYD
jgi:hypothetical protein